MMEETDMANNKVDKKKMMTRVICLALAGIMVLSAVLAAIFSQVY